MIHPLEIELTNDILDVLEIEETPTGILMIDGLIPVIINNCKMIKLQENIRHLNKNEKLFRPFFSAAHSDFLQQFIVDQGEYNLFNKTKTVDDQKYYKLIAKDEDDEIIKDSNLYFHIKYANLDIFMQLYLGLTKKEAASKIKELLEIYEGRNIQNGSKQRSNRM